MQVRPDEQVLVTGSADKDVKFWEFDREDNDTPYSPIYIRNLTHVKTLKMTDEDRKSTRLNSSHSGESRMPSSA